MNSAGIRKSGGAAGPGSSILRERLKAAGTYLAVSAAAHLAWEVAQLPLYALWHTGKAGEIAFAVIHCTLGDLVIALWVLGFAVLVTASRQWPRDRSSAVWLVAVAIGVAYTAYSEWYNVYVHRAWEYSAAMPTIELFGFAIGVTPLLQWIVVPTAAFWTIRRTC